MVVEVDLLTLYLCCVFRNSGLMSGSVSYPWLCGHISLVCGLLLLASSPLLAAGTTSDPPVPPHPSHLTPHPSHLTAHPSPLTPPGCWFHLHFTSKQANICPNNGSMSTKLQEKRPPCHPNRTKVINLKTLIQQNLPVLFFSGLDSRTQHYHLFNDD